MSPTLGNLSEPATDIGDSRQLLKWPKRPRALHLCIGPERHSAVSAFLLASAVLPSRKSKRDHVCAICDGCHGLTLASFDSGSHVSRQVRARTRMISRHGHENCSQTNMEGKSFNAGRSAGGPLCCCQLRKDRSRPTLWFLASYSTEGS